MASHINRLLEGNARFVEGSPLNVSAHPDLSKGQSPFAIILSCSDSRVPSERIFDADMGELFVIRVAGNVVAPSIVGSVEFATGAFGTSLVVVMGHTHCGAVKATMDAVTATSPLRESMSENVRDIIDRIAPSITEIARSSELSESSKLRMCTHANIRASVNHLKHASRLIESKVCNGSLVIIGAEYDIESGAVEFLI